MLLDLLVARLPARKTLSQKYSFIRWIVYTFLGGVINTVALLLFANFYNDVSAGMSAILPTVDLATGFTQIIFALVFVFFLPIMLSLIFSKFSPELQIVSPLNMEIISLGGVLLCLYTQHWLLFANVLYTGAYAILSGLLQDGVAASLIGQMPNKDNIFSTSMVIETDVSNLQLLLQTKKFRENLHLEKKIEDVKGSVVLRSPSDFQYRIIIMLTKGEHDKQTFMDMAVFKKGKYALERTDELEEFAKNGQLDILRGIFRRTSIHARMVKKPPEEHAETLNELVEGELKGKVSRIQMATGNWIKLGGVFASISLCLGGYYEHWIDVGAMLAILIPTIIYALFEFSVKERRERT